MRKHELYTDYHDFYEYFGNTEIERIRKHGDKTIRHDWLNFIQLMRPWNISTITVENISDIMPVDMF